MEQNLFTNVELSWLHQAGRIFVYLFFLILIYLVAIYSLRKYYPKQGEIGWLSMVRASFKTQIMSPVTSFIVVENEAQKAALKRKQEQLLNGDPALDPGKDVTRMSEPTFWLLFLILGSFFYYHHWSQRLR